MNKAKALLLSLLVASSAFLFTACEDDEEFFDRPSVSANVASSTFAVVAGTQATINFSVDAPGGFQSATTSAGNITSTPTVGDLAGTVVVTLIPNSAGTTPITLTVTDQGGKSSTATAVVVANELGAPTITGVPAQARIAQGDTLGGSATGPIVISVSAEAGIASLELVVNGGTPISVGSFDGSQTTATVDAAALNFAPMAGTYDLVFTLTDTNGETATATHTLLVTAPVMVVADNITTNTTWSADTVYELAGRIAVLSGVTLEIEAGTIVKGQEGSGANASALLIARGGTLMAMGTANAPIIFTSETDQIEPGQIVSPNLDINDTGLWGGLIILGNAPIAADAEAVQIEGIPPSDQNGLYGGSDPNDNSGVIQYISIRHGGSNIGEGNEINALTLGGVGNGTTISHVEILANEDDGLEPFGGTVDISNIVIWGVNDDFYDCDQGYSGTIYNFAGILGDNGDHGMELDGPEGPVPANISGSFTLRRGTIKGDLDASGGEYIDLRSDVRCTIDSVYFFNFKSNSDVEFDNNGVSQNYLDGEINLTNLEFNVSHLSEGNTTIPQIFVERVDEDDEGNPTEEPLDIFTNRPIDPSNVIATSNTVGADVSVFSGWSWADVAGELADF